MNSVKLADALDKREQWPNAKRETLLSETLLPQPCASPQAKRNHRDKFRAAFTEKRGRRPSHRRNGGVNFFFFFKPLGETVNKERALSSNRECVRPGEKKESIGETTFRLPFDVLLRYIVNRANIRDFVHGEAANVARPVEIARRDELRVRRVKGSRRLFRQLRNTYYPTALLPHLQRGSAVVLRCYYEAARVLRNASTEINVG